MTSAISTLCATSTVLVAPLGLTFGRSPDDRILSTPSAQLSQRRQQQTAQREAHPQREASPSSSRLMTSYTPSKTSTPSPRPLTSSNGPPSAWDSHRSSIIREDTEFTYRSRPIAQAYPDSFTQSQRPSSSISEHAVRRSTTYSSTSVQPFFTPERPPTHRPNKLVKRSLSQNVAGNTKNRDSLSQKPLFRRPATSHQRAASWGLHLGGRSEQSSPLSESVSVSEERNQAFENQSYVHFPRIVKARKTIKGLSRHLTDKDPETTRRIRPDGSRLTLLFAKSVIPAQIAIEEVDLADSDLDSPQSFSAEQRYSPTTASSPLNPSSGQTNLRSERHRRQSFANFKNSPTRMLSSSHGPASKLKRKLSQRISSAPAAQVPPMGSPRGQDLRHSPKDPSTPRPESGYFPPTRSSSVRRHPPPAMTPTHTRQVSASSGPSSSSPDGSYAGQRVFSWGEGEEEGSTSETVYDSFRTGTTRSSYGTARQPLETLFDKSSTTVNDQPQARSPFLAPRRPGSQQTISTDDRASFVSAQATPSTITPRRSPPSEASWATAMDLGEDFADDEADWDSFPNDMHGHGRSPFLPPRLHTPKFSHSPNDPARSATPRADPGLRNSVFDWSEPTPVDKGSDHDTPPRPKTVHGKKRQGNLGNQSTSRRTQGGLHARSQSVPAFQDLTGRRPDVTHKFGTWGVGGKGATEDWDDDFDFAHPSQSSPIVPKTQADDAPNNFAAMRIPDNIQKQQNNVLANIGLLKEWGLLIEELKDLRIRAATLGIRGDDHAAVFDEVDAMIDLADQEHEDDALSTLRSPSSTHFSDDEHEGFTPPRSLPAGQARMSPSEMLRAVQQNNSVNSSPNFRPPESSEPSAPRPRKDSEAVAQSVIQALQRGKRREPESSTVTSSSSARAKKMPFDTNTLKHIVPHVNSLMRQVKQLLKEAEGLHTSPKTDRHANFSRRMSPPTARPESPSAQREFRLRLQRNPSDLPTAPGVLEEEEEDLEEQLRRMDLS